MRIRAGVEVSAEVCASSISILRIIYLYVEEAAVILLMTVYDKDEADDLNAEQRRAVAELARAFKVEVTR